MFSASGFLDFSKYFGDDREDWGIDEVFEISVNFVHCSLLRAFFGVVSVEAAFDRISRVFLSLFVEIDIGIWEH